MERLSARCWISLIAIAGSALAAEAGNRGMTGPAGGARVAQLARKLDRLEVDLQQLGRVTVKSPDVWGQSRLTEYREEFERHMAVEINSFAPSTQAGIRFSDQAVLNDATALNAILSGNSAPSAEAVGLSNFTSSDGSTSTTVDLIRTGQLNAVSQAFNSAGVNGNSLEPELLLDQKARFLQHLHELRRINEGDDTSDLPGYSLNLIRLPVSVMPGDLTRRGYGAEVTCTIEPYATPELLPSTFRQLVIKDLLDVLALPLRNAAEDYVDDKQAQLTEICRLEAEIARLSRDIKSIQEQATLAAVTAERNRERLARIQAAEPLIFRKGADGKYVANLSNLPMDRVPPLKETLESISSSAIQSAEGESKAAIERIAREIKTSKTIDEVALKGREFASILESQATELIAKAASAAKEEEVKNQEVDQTQAELVRKRDELQAQTFALRNFASPVAASSQNARRSRLPIPNTQVVHIFGDCELRTLIEAITKIHKAHGDKTLHLTDVRSFLRDELEAAYDFLKSQTGVGFWELTPLVVEAVRGSRFEDLQVPRLTVSSCAECPPGTKNSVTRALAWAILVEAAILDRQLNEDYQRVSQDPECGCMGGTFAFYDPNPSPEARQAFLDYVRCRWPIQVFAIDPASQEQSVRDQFSARRELQILLAASFARGRVSLQRLTQFARRIEFDIDTIALNRTQVGFSQDNDTFGWRFYPRVQTPNVESNVTVITRDLLIGGPRKDALLRQREIEPGPRECTAIVVMPSFVPHARIDIRTKWFELAPCHKGFRLSPNAGPTTVDTIEWSREAQSLENMAMACVADEQNYLPGEVDRIVRRTKQLIQQFPMQTQHIKVPYEDDLGGFELFSAGSADLAPELFDFYGEPGVNLARSTSLFLVGDNFSLHGTRVLVGNRILNERTALVPPERKINSTTPTADSKGAATDAQTNPESYVRMLSRQVLEVKIPPDVQTIDGGKFVDVHVATPYGVTQHLEIPVVRPQAAAAADAGAQGGKPATITWNAKDLKLGARVTYAQDDATIERIKISPDTPLELSFSGDLPEPFKADGPYQLAFKAELKPRNSNEAAVKFSAGTVDVVDGKPIDYCQVQTALNKAIRKAGTDTNSLEGYDSLTLVGYVRGADKSLPVTKIADPLTITLFDVNEPFGNRDRAKSSSDPTDQTSSVVPMQEMSLDAPAMDAGELPPAAEPLEDLEEGATP